MKTHALFASFALVAFAAFLACGEDSEPGGGPNGDGDASTNDDGASGNDSGGGDAGPDAPIVYPDPLEGTTKVATLVAGGFLFTEGPLWIGGKLLFTDIPANNVVELLPDGGTTVFRPASNGTNGLAIDKDGNLLACEQGMKRVVRSPPQGNATRTAIASTYMGPAFNAPNDVIARADGNVYFTDPCYGCTATQNDEAVYRIDTAGAVTRLAQNFTRPNGIALSPDGNTLYVVDNGAGQLLSAPVDNLGGVGSFTMIAPAPGGDGMAVDDAGNLYITVNAGVDVWNKTATTKLGTITVARKPANCTFGGADRKTLYITANGPQGNPQTGLYEMKLNVPGLP